MKVTIWDLDYYYTEEKRNCFNPDVMKISSYHKQLGDKINFVLTQDDINRDFDLFYIIKEKLATKNPPKKFFLDKRVKWWGNAVRPRVKWKMNDAMLGCRPDYLLYPEHNTQLERAEHIRMFNDNAELISLYQDYKNSFKNKKIIITDKNIWYAKKQDLLEALSRLENTNSLYFLHPIDLERIINDNDIQKAFLALHFSPGVNFVWMKIKNKDFDKAFSFLKQLKMLNPSTKIGTLKIKYSDHPELHWTSNQAAIDDFNSLKSKILKCKQNRIELEVLGADKILETPYNFIFSVISSWTHLRKGFKKSWLEFITLRFSGLKGEDAINYWNKPISWDLSFRELLRQTYQDKNFMLSTWGCSGYSETNVPWLLFKEEFKESL